MAPKTGPKSKPAQIAEMKERRRIRALVANTITEMDAYIKDQQSASLEFRINSIGLRVERGIAPCSIQLIQPGIDDVYLNVRKQSMTSALVSEQTRGSESFSEIDQEEHWLPLQDWLARRYGNGSNPEEIEGVLNGRGKKSNSGYYDRLRFPATEDTALEEKSRDDRDNESLYQAIVLYTHHRHCTDFEFWRRTVDVEKCLSELDDESFSYYQHNSRDQPVVDTSVAVSADRTTASATRSTVAQVAFGIGVHRRLLPLLTWMESREPAALTVSDWWKAIGTWFRFMDLPLEIREIVYGHLLGPYTWPHEMDHSWNEDDNDMRIRTFHPDISRKQWITPSGFYGGQRRAQDSLLPLPTVLPQVSKQLLSEVTRFTWAAARPKAFDCPDNFERITPYLQAIYPCKTLRRVSLHFPNTSLFRFLGLYTNHLQVPFQELEDFVGISQLRSLTTLQHLHFRFETSPPVWHKVKNGRAGWLTYEPWCTTGHSRIRATSCQKTLVDWFLTLAFEALCHIPQVTFSGHIKNSTRAEWNAVFEQKPKDRIHNFSQDIAAIRSTPMQHL
jgi:hypothetical protein